MNYKKLSKYLFISFGLLLLRYFFSVLIIYFFPLLHWVGYGFKKEFSQTPFITKSPPILDIFSLWHKWDSTFYFQIVKSGYEIKPFDIKTLHNWAFFPFYPFIIKILAFPILGNNQLVFWVGVLFSTLCFGLFLYFLDITLELIGFDKAKKLFVLLIFIIFPSSYFLTLFYPESLFLLLNILFFYFLIKKKYILSSAFLSLALVTKLQGLLLIPVLIFHFLVYKNKTVKSILSFLFSLVIIFVPITLFFSYLKIITGNFFAAADVQKTWQNNFVPFAFFSSYLKAYGLSIKFEHFLSIIWIFVSFIFFAIFLEKVISKRKLINQNMFIFFLHFFLSLILTSSISSLNSIFRYSLQNIGLFVLIPYFIPKKIIYNWVFLLLLILLSYGLQMIFFSLFLTSIPAYGF